MVLVRVEEGNVVVLEKEDGSSLEMVLDVVKFELVIIFDGVKEFDLDIDMFEEEEEGMEFDSVSNLFDELDNEGLV